MKVYKKIEDIVPLQNAVVATGTFDGIHKGHQFIISRVKQRALELNGQSAIITFNNHPQIVLNPTEKELFILNTETEKIQLLEKMGIDHLIIIPFTPEFATTSYSDFVKNILVEKLHVRRLIMGYDHHFGKDRTGSFQHLSDFGKMFHFETEKLNAQKVENKEISSTKIRKALLSGNIVLANSYLGYEYFLNGKVVHGNRIGQTMGFPTANIETDDPYKLIPANGVYAVNVEYKGEIFGGMLNIGSRPTISNDKKTIEVHIFNFEKDIYSEYLNVIFVKRLRDEIAFPGIPELKVQLEKDKENALTILSKY